MVAPTTTDEDSYIGDNGFSAMVQRLKKLEEQKETNEALQVLLRQYLIGQALIDVDLLTQASKLSTKGMESLARFDMDEIETDMLLGCGGFSRVYEIYNFFPKASVTFSPKEQAARDALMNNVRQHGDCQYAVKFLRKSVAADPKKMANGIVDLAMEAHIMSALDHPNILSIRGVAQGGPERAVSGRHDGFFIVIDKINETLYDRIHSWKKRQKRLKRALFLSKRARQVKEKQLMMERLVVAHEIASALEYLHSQNLIHRDIKPSNVGFDADGVCQIFDFGLARELLPQLKDKETGRYKLSGKVGTTRWMAPEVFESHPYDHKADVYSFSLVLFAILSLTQPFEQQETMDDLDNIFLSIKREQEDEDRSVRKGKPPQVSPSWPVSIQKMLEKAWSTDISGRPTMTAMRETLNSEIEEMRDLLMEEQLQISTKRRSSPFVLKRKPVKQSKANLTRTESARTQTASAA